ncbi:MAG: anti-sigma factor antagonist [Anaerolineales bacterium]|nr:anti-sigma factor antagonist [Anaerolineales bacterium]
MEIETKEYKRVTVVTVSGRVDSATAGEFENQLKGLIEAGKTRIIVDMAEVEFLASAALRVLVTARKTVQGSGGDLVIAQPSQRVTDTLDIAGLDVLFKTYPDREAAIGAF